MSRVCPINFRSIKGVYRDFPTYPHTKKKRTGLCKRGKSSLMSLKKYRYISKCPRANRLGCYVIYGLHDQNFKASVRVGVCVEHYGRKKSLKYLSTIYNQPLFV